jgi:hypothetical protein
MAATLLFEDINDTFLFSIRTNLINSTDDNFTAVEVTGLNALEVSLGANFRQLPYTVAAMITFAYNHGLKLTRINQDGTVVVLSALNANIIYYANSGLGIDSL